MEWEIEIQKYTAIMLWKPWHQQMERCTNKQMGNINPVYSPTLLGKDINDILGAVNYTYTKGVVVMPFLMLSSNKMRKTAATKWIIEH